MDNQLKIDGQPASSYQLFWNSIDLVQRNITPIIILSLIPTLVLRLAIAIYPNDLQLAVAIYLISLLWIGINTPVVTYFTVKTARGKSISVGEAYRQGLRYFFKVLGYSVITGLLIALGFMLLIVPGLIFLRRYLLGNNYIVDKGMTIGEAMEASARDSKKYAGYIWGTIGVAVLYSLLTGIVSVALMHIPAIQDIASAILGLAILFIFPLRYLSIVDDGSKAKKKA